MDDVISRQGVIEVLSQYPLEKVVNCISIIEQLPSAQPERKTGKWLPDNNGVYEMRFICSECRESQVVPTMGFTKYKPIWDFCPLCGAKMEG